MTSGCGAPRTSKHLTVRWFDQSLTEVYRFQSSRFLSHAYLGPLAPTALNPTPENPQALNSKTLSPKPKTSCVVSGSRASAMEVSLSDSKPRPVPFRFLTRVP